MNARHFKPQRELAFVLSIQSLCPLVSKSNSCLCLYRTKTQKQLHYQRNYTAREDSEMHSNTRHARNQRRSPNVIDRVDKPYATALEAAKDLKERTPPNLRNQVLSGILETWGLPEGLQALAETYGEYYGELAAYLKVPEGAPALPGDTIITYYQALTGGGVENVQQYLVETWKSLGYKVVIVLEEEPDKAVAERIQAPIYVIPAASVENYAERAIAFEKVLEKTGAKTIVYHKWLCRVLLWDLLLMKSHDMSFICHTHGTFSHSMHNGDLLFSHLAPAYSLCDALIALSPADCFFWSHFNSRTYETINPTGLSVDKMEPSVNPKKHDILWLARISPEKGPENALLIFQKVLSRVPDATLNLVGAATSIHYQRTIDRLVHDLGIENHVNMPGWTNEQKGYYQDADVFLMTSTDEGFALTLAESRYYGVPCVMFDLPTLTLQGEEFGIESIPQGDNSAAADALVSFLLDEERNARYRASAQKGYRTLYENFDFAKFWNDVFLKVDCHRIDNSFMNYDFFSVLYREASFHYTCGIKSRNERISHFAQRAERAEAEAKRLSDENRRLRDEAQGLSNEVRKLTGKVRRLSDKTKRLADDKLAKNDRIKRLKTKLIHEREARERMKTSISWKVGRAITAIPRRIKKALFK